MTKPFGNTWAHRLGRWRKELRQQSGEQFAKAAQRLADDMRRQVKKNIISGNVGGPALSAATVAQKGHGRKLIDTGAMLDSINVAAGSENGEPVFYIGVFEYEGDAPEDLPLLHEQGRGVPRREVWARSAREALAMSPASQALTGGKWFDFRSTLPQETE